MQKRVIDKCLSKVREYLTECAFGVKFAHFNPVRLSDRDSHSRYNKKWTQNTVELA